MKLFIPLLPPLALLVLGLAVALAGRHYGIGSLTAMGPGFMPVLLGVLLALLAAGQLVGEGRQLVRGAFADTAQPVFSVVPLVLSAGSILLWAALVESTGFIPAALGQLAAASLATRQPDLRSTALVIVVASGLAYLLFVTLLGLPVPAFGG